MPEQMPQSEQIEQLVALAPMRNGRLLLALGSADRWHATSGYVLAPLELVGESCDAAASAVNELRRLARLRLGCEVEIRSSAHLYGPSAAHAIDRLAADPAETPTPVLRLQRMLPRDEASGADVRPISVRVYLAQLVSEPTPGAGIAALLEMRPTTLGRVVRGLPLGELLTQDGVSIQPNVTLPENLLLYCPGDYGERHLLRIAAKYGPASLLQVSG